MLMKKQPHLIDKEWPRKEGSAYLRGHEVRNSLLDSNAVNFADITLNPWTWILIWAERTYLSFALEFLLHWTKLTYNVTLFTYIAQIMRNFM